MPGLKLEIFIACLLGALLAGFGAGWMVNGWRLSGDVEKLNGIVETQKQSLETFEGANKRCTASVADVKGAVKAIADDATARAKAAAEAMARAEAGGKAHLEAAKAALNRPMPAAGKECDAIVREAVDYATKRKGGK